MALAKKPKTLKNTVNPLDWKIPIVNKNGTPTDEFMRKWLQQAVTNSTIVDLTTVAGVSAVLDLITAVAGSLLVRGAVVWQGLPPASDATKFLNGAATPAYVKVKDTDLAVTDVTGNNVSTAAHGFAPKAPNDATMFLNGLGAYSVPASGGGGAASIQDDGTTVFIALSDADGQLVLDGSGDPIFSPEVFPPSALPPGVYPGVANDSAAGAGVVGESISNYNPFGAPVAMASGTPNDVATIVLQPGDYLVFGGSITKISAGDAITQFGLWISDVSATFPADISNKGAITLYNTTAVVNNNSAFSAGCPMHFHVAAGTTKTVYLTGRIFFGSAASMSGYLEAIRLR